MIYNQKSRRDFIKATTMATGAALAAPYVKTAHSAGKLRLGLWDHWVPGANEVMRFIVDSWATSNRLEVAVDFVTIAGEKLTLTAVAEARARTGHDVIAFPPQNLPQHWEALEPVDDVVGTLTAQYGPFLDVASYLGKHDGSWRAVPPPTGTPTFPMVSRIDLLDERANLDIQAVFPAGPRDEKVVARWTYATFLDACHKLHAAGHPFGGAIGHTQDAQSWLGPLFLAFGSEMVNAKREVTVNSEGTRAALDYLKHLSRYMPEGVYAWDDAGNNRWLISGRGGMIQNPPSAWAVAKRDAPEIAAQCWHHDAPAGPNGRYRTIAPFFWGIWAFSANTSAAKDRSSTATAMWP